MIGLPYLILAAIVAVAIAAGGGYHYGAKGAATELATVKAYADSLATQVSTVEADCKKALDALQTDTKKRKRAIAAARSEAANAKAGERAAVNNLRVRSLQAADSAANCREAQAILDQLAKDVAK